VFGMIKFTVDGEPQGKTEKGGGFKYVPAKTKSYQKKILESSYPAIDDMPPLECAVAIHVRAYFKPPAKTPKYRLALMASGDVRPTKYPSSDKIINVLDVLCGVAWIRQAQLVTTAVEKFYSPEPRLEVTYWPHSGKDLRLIK
jgi:Holliday junction resolvase RusA-like endonuclease